MNASRQDQVAFLFGRIAVGGMYASAGIANLFDLEAKAAYVASKGVFEPKLLVFLASLLLVVGGISFTLGLRPRIGVVAIMMFLIPVTLIIHNFWAFEGMERLIEMRAFMGNLGLLGSTLMFLAIPRAWAFSLEGWLVSHSAARRPHATKPV
jgi:putative oxidoreductase